jgi:hypothetical protein
VKEKTRQQILNELRQGLGLYVPAPVQAFRLRIGTIDPKWDQWGLSPTEARLLGLEMFEVEQGEHGERRFNFGAWLAAQNLPLPAEWEMAENSGIREFHWALNSQHPYAQELCAMVTV